MSIRSFFKPKDAVQVATTALPAVRSRSASKKASTTDSADEDCAEKPAKKAKTASKASKSLDNGTDSVEEQAATDGSVKAEESRATAQDKVLTPEMLDAIQKKKEAALERKRSSASAASDSKPASDGKISLGSPETIVEAANLLPESWKEILSAELSKDYFKSLSEFVRSEKAAGKVVYPPIPEVFSAFHLCPFDKIAVVIVGQDPYHGPGQAHGLAFSVQNGVPPPPSLVNMYKELEQDPKVDFRRPKHGCLTKWAEQGVFMLNTVLTVRQKEPNSHQKRGWEQFTDAVIAQLNKRTSGLVFLLWGRPAADKCRSVDGKRHVILTAMHPSPLSASKGFFGCRHFSKVNEHLKAVGRPVIDWQV